MGYITDLRKIEGVGHRPLMMVACGAFIFDNQNRILLEQRADDQTWCVPGGSMELGETPEEAVRRECREETGLILGEVVLHNVISGECSHFTYPNGDEVYAVDINFICKSFSGTLKKQDEEVLQLKFFDRDTLPYKLSGNDRRIIDEIWHKTDEIVIRHETKEDYRKVEEIHRRAFWNQHVPGCDEHYLAHVLRKHKDFIPELDYVAELDGRVIANVMYTRAKLVSECGGSLDVLTFGPLGVEPEYQRRGIGRDLLEKTFEKAKKLGYKAIVIFGNPENYVSRGFKSCKKYNVCLDGDVFPTALLVKELEEGVLGGTKYYYQESSAYEIDVEEAAEFDKNFETLEKKYKSSQEEFYILSHSVIG